MSLGSKLAGSPYLGFRRNDPLLNLRSVQRARIRILQWHPDIAALTESFFYSEGKVPSLSPSPQFEGALTLGIKPLGGCTIGSNSAGSMPSPIFL